MECERIRRKLSPFLDGELDDEETRLVLAHLRSCNSCAQEYDELERVGDLLSDLEGASAPGYLSRRIEARVASPPSIGLWPRLVHRLVYASAVAALFLGVLIGNQLGEDISERLSSEEGQLVDGDLGDYPTGSLADVYLDGWEE